MDSLNGVKYPTLDAGCRVTWQYTSGVYQQPTLTGAVVAPLGNDSSALAQVANVSSESIRVYNGSQNHIKITDGTNEWGVNIDGSGNLRLDRVSGTGGINLASNVGVMGAAPISKVTGFGTPTGAGVISNFPGASATLAQCSQAIAEIVKDLQAFGVYGA